MLRLAMVPLMIMALLGIATAAILAFNPPTEIFYTAIGVAGAGCIAVLIIGYRWANSIAIAVDERIDEAASDSRSKVEEITQNTQQWIKKLRISVEQGIRELPVLVDQIRAGRQPAPRWPTSEPGPNSNPFALLAHEIRRSQAAVEFALLHMRPEDPELRAQAEASNANSSVRVSKSLAHRVQFLAHQALQELDKIEHKVEDPELLKQLFAVDHQVTRIRRQGESLGVLSGSAPRRRWSHPVPVDIVLRSAVAEVENYVRVKVIPPIDGNLHGHAVADVIHVVAELVENATTHSPPDTQVTLSAQRVTAGLAIDIRDRGLGIDQATRVALNKVLQNPDEGDGDVQLGDGRIGVYVVAKLARRYQIAVELENNMYGGTDAHLVIPNNLLGTAEEDEAQPEPQSQPEPFDAFDKDATAIVSPRQNGPKNGAPQNGVAPEQPRRMTEPVPEQPTRQRQMTYNDSPPPPPAPSNSSGFTTGIQQPVSSPPPPPSSGGSGYGRHSSGGPSSPAESTDWPQHEPPSNNQERPSLPKRSRDKTYLAPQLADSPPPQEENEDTTGAPNPGLWASFRSGVFESDRDGNGPGSHSI